MIAGSIDRMRWTSNLGSLTYFLIQSFPGWAGIAMIFYTLATCGTACLGLRRMGRPFTSLAN